MSSRARVRCQFIVLFVVVVLRRHRPSSPSFSIPSPSTFARALDAIIIVPPCRPHSCSFDRFVDVVFVDVASFVRNRTSLDVVRRRSVARARSFARSPSSTTTTADDDDDRSSAGDDDARANGGRGRDGRPTESKDDVTDRPSDRPSDRPNDRPNDQMTEWSTVQRPRSWFASRRVARDEGWDSMGTKAKRRRGSDQTTNERRERDGG